MDNNIHLASQSYKDLIEDELFSTNNNNNKDDI
jgi:hypothetical protein